MQIYLETNLLSLPSHLRGVNSIMNPELLESAQITSARKVNEQSDDGA